MYMLIDMLIWDNIYQHVGNIYKAYITRIIARAILQIKKEYTYYKSGEIKQ